MAGSAVSAIYATGFLGLIGEKVDAIDHYNTELDKLSKGEGDNIFLQHSEEKVQTFLSDGTMLVPMMQRPEREVLMVLSRTNKN
ncbi:hypothetical protein PIB30_001488 [Stylosanthes scabra]|uniref:Uncharacterized protein n=1 Tax=Stylosanthes scabra TaxID=79078 RepID=A0ABU6Q3J8_9FABA|nr:hypothetical protein [Stylosanthes scabra]